ncbi:MAG: S41 family peptidase [Clostridiales bacterium]|nr:S41 family peptidase [Clostridiales bacterium]
MKNKFWAGFLTGLAGTILVVTVGLGVNKLIPNTIFDNNNVQKTEDGTSKDVDEVLEKLQGIDNLINRYYIEDVDENDLIEGMYKGYVAGIGDPYSTYYTVDEYKALMDSSSGIYYGIGATVSQDVTTGIIRIIKPFVSSPAYEAGLLPEDILYKVDGEEVTGIDLTEVVSKIKGPEGTTTTLTIIREGVDEELEIEVTRRKIEVPTIEHTMLDSNIGYIAISEFDKVTVDQFLSAVEELEEKGQRGLIIDVRNNPGGLLDSVTKMLDRLLPEGLIVYTEDKYGNREEIKSNASDYFDKPLVVLTNGNSASASEIFAGAIQDYGIGKVVGTNTFGKGIVQSIFPLPDDTAVKVTVSKYFTPNGRDIHEVGIAPDVEVELDEELRKQVVIEKEKDNQLQKGIEVLEDLITNQK